MGYPFNQIPFGKQGEYVTTVIEIPKGSMLKVEWRRHEQFFALDRVEPGIFAKPTNYGFIPQTLDEDGDELDVLMVTGEPLPMGLVIEQSRVIGMVDFEDDGENDHKVICVPVDDRHRRSRYRRSRRGLEGHQRMRRPCPVRQMVVGE
jgi:inorganic pyrophosphatase